MKYAKIKITGTVTTTTGMHIGGGLAFSAIGAVDAPIVRDTKSGLPMLPGSSLKGKMRTLLAKEFNDKVAEKPDYDCERLLRLFGSSKKGNVRCGRLIFSDTLMSNWDDMKNQGLQSKTEIKFENTINRLSAVANPRQIERTISGTEFPLDLIYELTEEKDGMVNEADALEDFDTLLEGMRLLTYDYLGGNGTRGYGKVTFSGLSATPVVGNVPEEFMNAVNGKIKAFNG